MFHVCSVVIGIVLCCQCCCFRVLICLYWLLMCLFVWMICCFRMFLYVSLDISHFWCEHDIHALPVSCRAPLGLIFGGRGGFGIILGISRAIPGTSGKKIKHLWDACWSTLGGFHSFFNAFGLPPALSGSLRDQIWRLYDRIFTVIRASGLIFKRSIKRLLMISSSRSKHKTRTHTTKQHRNTTKRKSHALN